nr:L-serine ammonia-lyase, iron-sulfur-dependent, subunit alpha [uncultured Blautia sp.]
MEESRRRFYQSLLHREIAPALGCTEPAAAALTAACAAKCLGCIPEEILVRTSQYILKNAMNVGIPGIGMTGLDIAVALGALSASPEKKLMILSGISPEKKRQAKAMTEQGKVRIELASTEEKIYIEVQVRAGAETAKAITAEAHKNIIYVEKNDRVCYQKERKIRKAEETAEEIYTVTLEEILDFSEHTALENLEFLREVIQINREIALEGISHKYGLQVGKNLMDGTENGLVGQDAANYAAAMTAAAADARMAGCEKPVMSAAGSGNQGLTATIPIAAVGEKLELGEEKILRALALSILLTVHTKHYLGRLSVLCGCSISSAMGVACGIVFMLGGTYAQMTWAINSMVADISGVVCDGAKPGCALKIATAVQSAVRAANMALNGSGADSHDGIVHVNAEKTLENLGILGNWGMKDTNRIILDLMLEKQKI